LSIFIQIVLVGSGKKFFSARVRFDRSRSSKSLILVPIESLWDFLLVRHSNLGPI